jgi:Glyoxalase/Bleomycin resistance protein/Dioxygenase superfamily
MTPPALPLFEQRWPEGEFRFFQLGHVVDDLIGAAVTWVETFGVGPFHVLPVGEQVLTYGDGDVRTIRLQIAVAQVGPVQIELIKQHCETPSIYREWSRCGTSALHQVATVTSEYDAKTAQFRAMGHDVVAESLGGRFRVAYVDTVAAFGFYTEIVERTPGFLTQVHTISETCARWDGRDPVRLLTRDGYRVPGTENA